MYIVSSSGTESFSSSLSTAMESPIVPVERKRFPDGEQYIRVEKNLEDDDVLMVVNCRSESAYLESMLALEAIREMRPRNVIAFMPYFSYARQHMIYSEGEAVSARVILDSLSLYADSIVSIDVHDLSVSGLSKVPFRNLTVTGAVSKYYSGYGIDLIISPDDGGTQRAREIGKSLGVVTTNFEKVRITSTEVQMKIPSGVSIQNKRVLIVDDIISTGGTVIRSVELIRERKPSKVFVCGIHGIFVNGIEERISRMVDDLAVSNTVYGKFSKIDVTGEVASSLKGVFNGIRA